MADPFLGEIRLFSFNYAPRGWALCNGQLLPISQNQALFSVLGTTFGGDGRTTFGLPNMQSRIPVHVGQGVGLSNYVLGEAAGVESVTLSIAEMPAHPHTAQGFNGTGNLGPTAQNTWAGAGSNPYTTTSNSSMNPATIASNPGGAPHSNLAPYLAVTFAIALQGIFPSRN
jgi:microcystin-dependent protein